MRHLDLFSGIGGFALAASWIWGDEHELVAFCEIDKFCQKVLNKHWPNVPIIEDIRDVTNAKLVSLSTGNGLHTSELREFQTDNGEGQTGQRDDAEISRHRALRKMDSGEENERIMADTESVNRRDKRENTANGQGWKGRKESTTNRFNGKRTIDLLTGGFPCQPFSCAGKRQGDRDDRFLWPQLFRIIQEIHPTWLILENVAGIFSIFQYEGEPPLEDQGHPKGEIGDFYTRMGSGILYEILEAIESEGYEVQPFVVPACAVDAPHRRDRVWIVAYSNGKGLQRQRRKFKYLEKTSGYPVGMCCEKGNGSAWLPESRLGGMVDGPARWLDEPDIQRVATGAPDRVNRLKALGNAIVPQCVAPIMEVIKAHEDAAKGEHWGKP